jgi:hypothetical protein
VIPSVLDPKKCEYLKDYSFLGSSTEGITLYFGVRDEDRNFTDVKKEVLE